MIQSDFSCIIGLKPIRFSGSQFRFGVKALNDPAGKLPFGPKPIQQQWPMVPQHTSNLLHGFNLRAHCFRAPFIQKLSGPIRRFVRPEELKLFFQKIASDRFQIVLQKICQLGLLFRRQVFRALEQKPTSFGQYWLIPRILQIFCLLCAHLINRLTQVRHDVETIQNMDRMPRLLGDYLQVGFPHIATDIAQLFGSFLAKPAKESQQGFDLPLLANPQQSSALRIDLIDQCQVSMAPLPLDFINTDRLDPRQISVSPPPGNRHFHRAKYMVPTGAKGLGHLFPAQPLGPACQKPGIGLGQSVFPFCPGHPLHPDTASWTINPARCIEEKHLNAPYRNELKTPSWQRIVPRSSTATLRADGAAVSARMKLYLDSWLLRAVYPVDRSVHKRIELLDPIKDSLELHPCSFSLVDAWSHFHHLRVKGRDALPPTGSVNCHQWSTIPLFFTHKFS